MTRDQFKAEEFEDDLVRCTVFHSMGRASGTQKNVSRDTYLFVVIFSSILQCSMVCKWILSLTLLINDDGKWKPSNPKDGDDGDEWPCNDCT